MIESKQLEKSILEQCDSVSQWLKAIAQPVRLKILCALLEGEKTVTQLVGYCEVSQSAMSQYLARMSESELLIRRRAGQKILYRIRSQRTIDFLKAVKRILCESQPDQ